MIEFGVFRIVRVLPCVDMLTLPLTMDGPVGFA
jgi:hypothetical protein